MSDEPGNKPSGIETCDPPPSLSIAADALYQIVHEATLDEVRGIARRALDELPVKTRCYKHGTHAPGECPECSPTQKASGPKHFGALDGVCDDCPPIGYPTNKTRCVECPRLATTQKANPCSCGHDGRVGPGHQTNCPQYHEHAQGK